MGVFSWFRGKSSGRSTEDGRTAAQTVDESCKAPDEATAEPGPSEDSDTPKEPGKAVKSDDVEIPKQQSAEEAADSETGKGSTN